MPISARYATEYANDREKTLAYELNAWAQFTRKQLLYRLASLNLRERIRMETEQPLRKSIKAYLVTHQGAVEAVAFSFARHGIFLERGVGLGRPAGSRAAEQAAKPWIKPVMEPAMANLADNIARHYADVVAVNLRFLIPGIIDTTIRK